MKRISYDSVQTLLAIENKALRVGLREAFKHSGFDAFVEAGDQKSFQTAIETTSFDLIIMTAELSGFFVAPVIAAMRNGQSQHHAFPVALTLLADGEKSLVRKVIDSGPDDVMMMPVAPGPMLSRIDSYAVNRRPFVVTISYVGPDRRVGGSRPGAMPARMIDVPNPVRSAIRRIPEAERQSEIHFTQIHLNALMVDCYADQLLWLESAIRQMLRQNDVDKVKLLSFAAGMKKIAEDLPGRVTEGLPPRTEDLLRSLKDHALGITQAGADLKAREVEDILDTFLSLSDAISEILKSPPRLTDRAVKEALQA